MTQSRYGNGSASGRRLSLPTEPVDKAFGLPGASALKTSARTVGVSPTASALGSMVKPKIAGGLQAATKTPKRTLGTLAATGATGGLIGAGMSKGWGGDLARGASNAARKDTLRANIGRMREERELTRDIPEWRRFVAEDDFDRRSNRKSINFVERFRHDKSSGARRLARPGVKTSLPRGRSLTSEDKTYLGLGGSGQGTVQGVGGRAGDRVDYQLTGNKRVRKAYQSEASRQRRLGAYEAGLGLSGAAATVTGARGIRSTTQQSRRAAKLTEGYKDKGTFHALSRGITARRRDVGLVAGGAAALGAAGLVHQHATGKHGRAWN